MQDDAAGEPIAGGPFEAYQSLEVLGVCGRSRLDLDSDDPVRGALQDQIDLQPILVTVVVDGCRLVRQSGRLGDLGVDEAFEQRSELPAVPRDMGPSGMPRRLDIAERMSTLRFGNEIYLKINWIIESKHEDIEHPA